MSRRDDEISLRQMLDHAREIVSAARGRRRADLDGDRLFELGLTRLIVILGEAATRVSAERRAEHAEIPWRDITSMRNRLVHVYDDIDKDTIWSTVKEDSPALVSALERVLR